MDWKPFPALYLRYNMIKRSITFRLQHSQWHKWYRPVTETEKEGERGRKRDVEFREALTSATEIIDSVVDVSTTCPLQCLSIH